MDGRITPWAAANIAEYVSLFQIYFTNSICKYHIKYLLPFLFEFQEDCRLWVHSHTYIQPSAVIIPYLELAGFANVTKIASLKVDSKLIVALL